VASFDTPQNASASHADLVNPQIHKTFDMSILDIDNVALSNLLYVEISSYGRLSYYHHLEFLPPFSAVSLRCYLKLYHTCH
jgi:hypothetical protein